MADTPRGYTLQDPATGRPLEFNVPAVQEGEVDPRALARLFQGRKIAEAEKAMAAAIQFQGLRGYQNALESGKPAAEALTRYGPMMFYTRPQAFGPAMRAIAPPPPQDMIRSIPRGGIVGINRTNNQVTTIRPQEPVVRAPRRFNVAADVDPFGLREPSRLSMTGEEFGQFMQTAPPQVRTNAVNLAIQRMISPPAATNAPVTPSPTNAPAKKRLRWNVEKGDFE